MAIMHPTDWQIMKGLFQLHQGLTALAGVRQTTHEKLAMLKAQLDEAWQADLQPVMSDLYWYPFRNGIDEAPEDEEELRSWLERHYEEEAAIAALLALLQRYQIRAYDLGGQIALDFLNVEEVFRLTNQEIVDQLNEFARSLVTIDTEFSLIDTTIDDLVEAVPKARETEGSTLLALSAYIALHAAARAAMIERTERPRQVGNALNETYLRNDVAYMMYDVNGIGCPQVCAPWHGTVFRVGAQTVHLPQHPHCDCIWSSVLYDGQAVGYPPVVVSVPGLEPWVAPEELWTGS